MRSEFDCSSYNERECSIHNHAFYLGEQHQQSKVDELQKQRDSFIKAYEIEIDKSDELQKRVDRSLKIINDIQKNGLVWSQYSMGDLEQALKGGEP